MNTDTFGHDAQRSLWILKELSADDSLTQRDLSKRLGIALGLVNSYIKNLVSKGYITVRSIPPRRYAYFLTPKGFAEKTRLTYRLLQDYTNVYREARETLKNLFVSLLDEGAKKVVFAGADEVAEIAFLTLQETGLQLGGIVDTKLGEKGRDFFGHCIRPVRELNAMEFDCVVVTSFVKREQVRRALLKSGVKARDIKMVFPH